MFYRFQLSGKQLRRTLTDSRAFKSGERVAEKFMFYKFLALREPNQKNTNKEQDIHKY